MEKTPPAASRLTWVLILVLVSVVLVFGFLTLRRRGSITKNAAVSTVGVESTDPVRGEETGAGDVTLIEFGDFQCPYCLAAQPTLRAFLARHPSQVRLVWKDLPIETSHPQAREAAEAARCAQEQNAFWEMHDMLYANQNRLASDLYDPLADELGLDIPRFQECRESERQQPLIDATITTALAARVDGVPTYLMDGLLLPDRATTEEFDAFFNQAIESRQSP